MRRVRSGGGRHKHPPHNRSARDELEGKGARRGFQRRLGRRLETVAKGAGGGYCRLQMALGLAVAVRERAAGP